MIRHVWHDKKRSEYQLFCHLIIDCTHVSVSFWQKTFVLIIFSRKWKHVRTSEPRTVLTEFSDTLIWHVSESVVFRSASILCYFLDKWWQKQTDEFCREKWSLLMLFSFYDVRICDFGFISQAICINLHISQQIICFWFQVINYNNNTVS